MKDTVYFIVISLIMVVMAYFVAFGCEKLIEKKTHVKFSSEKTKVNKLVIMAMLSAVAVVLMYFDFPLVFFSEVPVLIGSFLLGPCAGVIIEAVKVLLHMCLKGTTTAFVGDFANFILGCAYVVPAAVIYHLHKTKKMAVVSLIAGGVILIISGTLLNAFYLLPKYSQLYGMPVSAFIEMGSKINGSIHNLFSFVALAVAPFNLIKSAIDGVVTFVLYKYLSRHLKETV